MADTNFIDRQTVIMADWLNDVNRLRYKSPKTSGGTNNVLYAQTDVDSDEYTLTQRLRNTFTLEMAYRSTDLGNWDNAFSRLINNPDCHAIYIGATQQEVFNHANTIVIPGGRNKLTIFTPAVRGATINLTGNDIYQWDVGNDSTVTFDQYWKNLIFTRANSTTSGAVRRMRNVYYWGDTDVRAFMQNKFWRFLEIISCSYGRSKDVSSENPIREHIVQTGGAGAAGAVGGWCVSNRWNELLMDGGHALTADPIDQGCFLMNDHVAASWLLSMEAYRHRGYAVYGKGTLANRSRNILNLIINPNVEATNEFSGTARFDNYASNQVRVGWSEGHSIPVIWLTANSQTNLISDMQYGLKGTSASGIKDDGTQNSYSNMELVGYGGAGHSGVNFGSTVVNPIARDIKVAQTAVGFNAASGVNNAGVVIEGFQFRDLSSGPFTSGLVGTGNAKISNVVSLDSASTPYLTAANTISPFAGYSTYYITGTTPIKTIVPTHVRQRLSILLGSGGSIQDIDLSLGNIVLKTSGSTFSGTGRSTITLEFDGTYWYETV